jgi:hypothetical protein
MKEYGSFLELDLRRGNEFYGGANVRRLNTARSGIYYVLRLLGLGKIVLPKYLCPSVGDFLSARHIDVSSCGIGGDLLPVLPDGVPSDTAVLAVNYFGILPRDTLESFVSSRRNVVVDCAQAFYCRPFENAYTVYSPRKFFGVPDGCYVIGEDAGREDFRLWQERSSDTSLFLLKRIEEGCEASYGGRMENEARLDAGGPAAMSKLTRALLDNIDYAAVREKRVENFRCAHRLFRDLNELDLEQFPLRDDTVPMVYPLVLGDAGMLPRLQRNKVFIGRWWEHVTRLVPENSIEMKLSRFMLPLPVDQRMDAGDIDRLYRLITADGPDAFSYKSEK